MSKDSNERKIPLDDITAPKNIIIAGVIVLVLFLALIFRPIAIVPAGNRGVIFNTFRGVDTNRVLGEGLHFIVPFVESVHNVEVRVQKADFEATAASADLQEVRAKLTVNYHLDPARVGNIYQQVGESYEQKLIAPSIQESIKAVTALYNATSLISKRPDVKEKVHENVRARLSPYNIIIDDVSITDFQFSPEFMKAIEAKQVAEQEAQKKKYELQKAEQDAAIEVARAEGERKATIARAQGQAEAQRLLRTSVSPEIIRLKAIEAQMKAIEKWDGHMPSVTGGTTPMFDVQNMMGTK